LFPRGIVLNRDLTTVYPVDPAKITESVSHSWYEYSSGDANGRHPAEGETTRSTAGRSLLSDFWMSTKSIRG